MKLSKPPTNIMYNSHGNYTKLVEIYELETERENGTFDKVPFSIIEKNANASAIWACSSAIDAFKYKINAEDWNLSNEDIINKYPDFINEIYEINTENFMVITNDEQGGYLLILKKAFTEPT